MKYVTPFHMLVKKVEKADIPFLLMGDYARYGYDRRVRVASLVEVLLREKDILESLALFKQADCRCVVRWENFIRMTNEQFPFLDIDLIYATQNVFDKIFTDSQEVELAGQRLRVPSLEDLNKPSFKKPSLAARSLSMDEYVDFVEFFIKHLADQTVYQRCQEEPFVGEPFRLK